MTERLIDSQTRLESKALLDANLTDTARIQVQTAARDAGGGLKATWSNPDPVACRYVALGGGADDDRQDQRKAIASCQVRFAAGTAVTVANRLVVTTEDNAMTRTLIVMDILRSPTHVRCYCRDATPAEL
jgi:hypothetical protein